MLNILFALLLALQAPFAIPTPVAYATPDATNNNVAVTVTFGPEQPKQVCTSLFALEDTDFFFPLKTHCQESKSEVGAIDVWKDTRITDGNFTVTLVFGDHSSIVIYLVQEVKS